MKHILASKIVRKLLILSCLIVGLFFVVSSGKIQSAEAAPNDCLDCRQYCRQQYRDCLANNPSQDLCFYNYENCLSYVCFDVCN